MAQSISREQWTRLAASQDYWLASVRPDGGAHLIPIWAVAVADSFYMGTEPRTQKVRNIEANPRVSLSLPNTREVIVLEGQATILEGAASPDVLEAFVRKYDWRFDPTNGRTILIRFTPEKVLSWNSDE